MVSQRISGILLAAILAIGIVSPASAMMQFGSTNIDAKKRSLAIACGAAEVSAYAAAIATFGLVAKNPILAAIANSSYSAGSTAIGASIIGTVAAGTGIWYLFRELRHSLANHTKSDLPEIEGASKFGRIITVCSALTIAAYYAIKACNPAAPINAPAISPAQ